ncbi:hypothetical protein BDF22DRAFT_671274, partial [Syncephalis plumigaleata]
MTLVHFGWCSPTRFLPHSPLILIILPRFLFISSSISITTRPTWISINDHSFSCLFVCLLKQRTFLTIIAVLSRNVQTSFFGI